MHRLEGGSFFISAANDLFAHEAILVNCVNGAGLCTFATAGTLIVVDNCEVLIHGDRTVRAGLYALHTADTAVGADLSCDRTLIVVGAGNSDLCGCVDYLDDAVGAGLCAFSAADTAFGNDLCNAVFDNDSILGADSGTVAVAEAGI